MEYQPVIGLEVHAELLTQSKMFCACPVVDATQSEPNRAVCPVCMGMPGMLPVINETAVEYGLRVALALECTVARTSIFARKNYFYPDLPKGYQISQFEYPLAEHGRLKIQTSQGERDIRIRRVHLEEDTGKLTHLNQESGSHSLVDLNRAGVPLLEIVSEPDMYTLEEVRAYAEGLRAILRCLGVNSGNMEKGVIRFEANVSVRPVGSETLGTRVEIKNLNSFRALERSSAYQIARQIEQIEAGGSIRQETLGWDEARGETYSQRSKEEAHDYRYFPEPDLPPLVVEAEWVARIAASLPELPRQKMQRYQSQFSLSALDAAQLSADVALAAYFEAAAAAGQAQDVSPKTIANWLLGELFAWMNNAGCGIETVKVTPNGLVDLLALSGKAINLGTAKTVLNEMLETGQDAQAIIRKHGLQQISDTSTVAEMVRCVLQENPQELASYLAGKETLANWFFGKVMRAAKGQANPQILRSELDQQLEAAKRNPTSR